MRIAFSIILSCLILSLLFCARKAGQSRKSLGAPVKRLLLALIPPMIGNLILIMSTDQLVSTIGCYIYFLGMDFVMLALLHFTGAYCGLSWPRAVRVAYALLGIDVVQLIMNNFTGHAFSMEEILAYGAPYYRLVPYLGQTFHRIVDYGILGAVLVIFIWKLIRSPRIDSERYSVILITMLITTAWETLYIFSRTPVDRSMVGFGVFGLLVFYFSLYYRPLRLLDRMLAAVASELPDALFFFDGNGSCIWANERGMELSGVDESCFDLATDRLGDLLGSTGAEHETWSGAHVTGSGDSVRSYAMERRTVTDDKGRDVGSLLMVRDNSAETKLLQKEIYNATHDSLTQVYNRAGYDLLLSGLELSSTLMILVDGDGFKNVNDHYGHEVGDRTLKRMADALRRNFRSEDYICRIGGDEFIVLMLHTGAAQYEQVRERIKRINAELTTGGEGIPPMSVSAGIAQGAMAADSAELFDQADRALYHTKHNGRCGLTFFSELAGTETGTRQRKSEAALV